MATRIGSVVATRIGSVVATRIGREKDGFSVENAGQKDGKKINFLPQPPGLRHKYDWVHRFPPCIPFPVLFLGAGANRGKIDFVNPSVIGKKNRINYEGRNGGTRRRKVGGRRR